MSDTAESTARQQQEASRFRSSVSESLLQGMQGNINFLLSSILPIGSIIPSMLSEAQFQELTSTKWVLMDGRNVSTSAYALLTGNTTIPDGRGIVLRGKNGARSTATGNADGDLALGTYQADAYKSHDHLTTADAAMSVIDTVIRGDGVIVRDEGSEYRQETGKRTSSEGSNETRMRNLTINYFIRIN